MNSCCEELLGVEIPGGGRDLDGIRRAAWRARAWELILVNVRSAPDLFCSNSLSSGVLLRLLDRLFDVAAFDLTVGEQGTCDVITHGVVPAIGPRLTKEARRDWIDRAVDEVLMPPMGPQLTADEIDRLRREFGAPVRVHILRWLCSLVETSPEKEKSFAWKTSSTFRDVVRDGLVSDVPEARKLAECLAGGNALLLRLRIDRKILKIV